MCTDRKSALKDKGRMLVATVMEIKEEDAKLVSSERFMQLNWLRDIALGHSQEYREVALLNRGLRREHDEGDRGGSST